MTDDDLFTRGTETLVRSWREFARPCPGAAVERLSGVWVAAFPNGPERAVYNNAVLDRDLAPGRRASAIRAMEAAYRAAGVDRYAAWVHESDAGMRAELEGRGYALAETTRAMGMSLDDLTLAPPDVDLAPPDLAEHLRIIGAPAGLLSAADRDVVRIMVARLAGANVATAMGFDHDGDRGIFNVGTLETARRRGLGTALTMHLVHDAAERGCSSASLQSTPMAERMYAAVGFRDLGRILEFVPDRGEGLTARR
jgi:GNAT superfamily N-acetyltransferase